MVSRHAAFAALALLALTACSHRTPTSEVYYSGPISNHFDGVRFFNPDGEQGSGGAQQADRAEFLKLALGKGGHHSWPKSVPVTPSTPPARIDGEAMRVTWIGHATTLVQTQGLNILIDPVWSERDSPLTMAGPRRVRQPGVRLKDLPKIDVVLISHNHYDHLDIPALIRIARRDAPLIITGLGNDKLLAEHHLKAEARDWGQSVTLRPGIEVILDRAHHWSARGMHDHDRALWSGFTITLPGGDLYYAGDTGPGDMGWASEARRRSKAIRFAILPIGPYHVARPQTGNHIGPADAVAAFREIGAAHALGVHWGTFELSDEPINGPPTLLKAALAKDGLGADRFRTVAAGEAWDVPQIRP